MLKNRQVKKKPKDTIPPPPSEGTFRGTARVRARLAAKAQEEAERERCGSEDGKARGKGRGSLKGEEEGGLGGFLTTKELVGRVVWAKLGRFPWWPAQVIDSSLADKLLKKDRSSETDILVRFFGTYDYAWIDSAHCLSDIETKFQERSKQRKRSFQKAVEEALECKKSGVLPRDWEVVPPDGSSKAERVTKKRKVTEEVDHNEGNGVVENGLQGVEVTSESMKGNPHLEGEEKAIREDDKDASKGRRTKAKKKPKSENTEVPILSEENEPQNRRLRVMRHLGLSPPPGSPFTPSSITNS